MVYDKGTLVNDISRYHGTSSEELTADETRGSTLSDIK